VVLALFILAHNTLRLKEIRLANNAMVSFDTAFTAVGPSSTTTPAAACTSPSYSSSPSGLNPDRDGIDEDQA
jgi:hypothetical protein